MSVAPALTVLETRRAPPPAELTEAEAAVWRDAMGCHRAGWFNKGQFPLLKAYCRHFARAELLAEQVNSFRPEWLSQEGGLERFDALLTMAERESRALSSLATRMRITQQSQYGERAAATAVRDANGLGPRPWDRFETESSKH